MIFSIIKRLIGIKSDVSQVNNDYSDELIDLIGPFLANIKSYTLCSIITEHDRLLPNNIDRVYDHCLLITLCSFCMVKSKSIFLQHSINKQFIHEFNYFIVKSVMGEIYNSDKDLASIDSLIQASYNFIDQIMSKLEMQDDTQIVIVSFKFLCRLMNLDLNNLPDFYFKNLNKLIINLNKSFEDLNEISIHVNK